MATIQDSAKSREVAVRENREGVTDLRAAIKASEGQFALALPRHVDAGRFMRCALTAINVVPKLGQCTGHRAAGDVDDILCHGARLVLRETANGKHGENKH